ncbi:MAG: amidohydrolase family protein [Parvibaculaceae bacterium]
MLLKTSRLLVAIIGLFSLSAVLSCSAKREADQRFDLILAGGMIFDGTGSEQYRADIGIQDGRIAAIGDLEGRQASNVLDVQGLAVAPGFIDTHSHADLALSDPETAGMKGFLRQGVTTAVYGVDGVASVAELKANIAASDAGIMGLNFMSYIGHNGVRVNALGNEDRAPSASELDQMRAEVKAGMDLGALGLSTGLMYLPGGYASSDEVIELAKVTAPYGGKYDSHIRDPANNWITSVTECLDIAKAAGVDAHLAHLKAVGGKNFDKSDEVIELINRRIAAGEDITADVYPYDGAATRKVMLLLYPADDEEGIALTRRLMQLDEGGMQLKSESEAVVASAKNYWRNIGSNPERYNQAVEKTENPPSGLFSWIESVGYQSMRIVVSENSEYRGRMVTELAESLNITPFELLRKMIVDEGANAIVTLGAIQEQEVRSLMKQPWSMVSSDGVEVDVEHPRGRGTFSRVLGRYGRDWDVFTLEEAVYKITGAPAAYLELSDRGVVREGAIADIAVFDPDRVIDNATWENPTLLSSGVLHVLIAGEFALRDEALTDARLGRFIPFAPSVSESR